MSTVIATFYNFGISPASGRLRLISSNGTGAPTVGTGVNLTTTDPIGFYFNGGSGVGIRALVVERVTNPTTFEQEPCYITVYNPASWTVTVPRTTYAFGGTSDYLLNIYNLNSPGGVNSGTLFGADYSFGRVFKFVHAICGGEEKLSLSGNFYQFTPTVAGATAYSADTAFRTEVNGQYVYAVAQQYTTTGSGFDPSDFTHYNSIIVKLNAANLRCAFRGPYATLAPNVFSIEHHNNHLYTVSLGGPQWNEGATVPTKWNYASRIEKVDPANLAATPLIRPANENETADTPVYNNAKFDIRALAFVGDLVYILTGSYNASFTFSGRFWWIPIDDLDAAHNTLISESNAELISEGYGTISQVFGFLWSLLPATNLDKVWGMLGNTLGVYDLDGLSGSAINAATASQWGAEGSPDFNAVTLAMPLPATFTGALKSAAPGAGSASVKSSPGFMHPWLISKHGVKPEDFDKFIKQYSQK